MRAINKTMGPSEWMLLILLSILFGGSFFFGKVALSELRPFSIVLVRVAVAAVALHLVVLAAGRRMPVSLKIWGRFTVMGILNNLVPFSLIFWGQTRIPSGLASILTATTPLWAVLIAHVLTPDEKLTPAASRASCWDSAAWRSCWAPTCCPDSAWMEWPNWR